MVTGSDQESGVTCMAAGLSRRRDESLLTSRSTMWTEQGVSSCNIKTCSRYLVLVLTG